MENQSTSSGQPLSGLKALLPAIFSAISVAMTVWIGYQNTQLKPKVDEISAQVQSVSAYAEQASGGVANLQQMDEARKRELFTRLTANRNNEAEVRQVFQEVFPEDEFWAGDELDQDGGGANP